MFAKHTVRELVCAARVYQGELAEPKLTRASRKKLKAPRSAVQVRHSLSYLAYPIFDFTSVPYLFVSLSLFSSIRPLSMTLFFSPLTLPFLLIYLLWSDGFDGAGP